MPNQEIHETFARTLAADYEDDDAWSAVRELRARGTQEVFAIAAEWCASDNPLKRARGADVLSQLGKTAEHRETVFRAESLLLLSRMLETEHNVQAQSSAVCALGHLDEASAIPLIAGYASSSESDVRFAVAFALGCHPNDDRCVTPLLELMKDVDDDVRDWATFGLGVLGDLDSDEIRAALLKNSIDTDEDVREEAMVGLAKRLDSRVLPFVRTALVSPCVSDRVIEAAGYLLGTAPGDEPLGATECLSALTLRFPNVG